MKTIITKLTALAIFSMLMINVLYADPIYMKIEGIDGSVQTVPVDNHGACSFKNIKQGTYKAYLLVPAVQKVREAASSAKGDDKHKEWIEIESWSWGASAREASAPSVSEIVVTKSQDKSSPDLFKGSSRGSSKIELKKQADHNNEPYYEIKLTDVLISSYQTGGSTTGGDRPMESLSLNFTKISYNYKPQNEESPAIQKGNWNLKENVK